MYRRHMTQRLATGASCESPHFLIDRAIGAYLAAPTIAARPMQPDQSQQPQDVFCLSRAAGDRESRIKWRDG
jgi:hypothetical protein